MKKVNYSEAIEELETIVDEIESDNISVDDLAEKVKRASELIRICKDVLYKTESEINKVLNDMQEGKPEPQA